MRDDVLKRENGRRFIEGFPVDDACRVADFFSNHFLSDNSVRRCDKKQT